MAVWQATDGYGGLTWVLVVCAGGGTLGLFFLAGGLAMLSQMGPLLEVARAHPLQAWPCQLERVPGGGRVLLLLAPDGSVARELNSDVPDEVWFRMTDGRGMLWIAGDLRFTCLVAAPGGRPCGAARAPPTAARDASRARACARWKRSSSER
ncbi:hypothetical protein [Streptomyces tailanensis]|uniref:hypothetical protein n=1 Tax=Streptomyces tailanensis TaxID=2569858 RepID=UPI00122DD9D9|nr:hypothetical protein [Streptomyces tailanensis]